MGIHIQKYITMALKDYKKLKRALWKEIFKGDREKVTGILIQKYNEYEGEGDKNLVTKCTDCIKNNWEEIYSYNLCKGEITECSAESHVSHVLSERLSRGPLSWSKIGAHKMAQLRALKANGNIWNILCYDNSYKKIFPSSNGKMVSF